MPAGGGRLSGARGAWPPAPFPAPSCHSRPAEVNVMSA